MLSFLAHPNYSLSMIMCWSHSSAPDGHKWHSPKGTGIHILQRQGPASNRHQHRQGTAERLVIQPEPFQGRSTMFLSRTIISNHITESWFWILKFLHPLPCAREGCVAGLGVHEAHPLRPSAGKARANRWELRLGAAVLRGDHWGQRHSPPSTAEHVWHQPAGEGAASEGGRPRAFLLQTTGAAQDTGRDSHHASGPGVLRSRFHSFRFCRQVSVHGWCTCWGCKEVVRGAAA